MASIRKGIRDTKLLVQSLFSQKHKLIKSIIDNGYTYLRAEPLNEIIQALNVIENKNIAGIIIENGVAKGGSAILLAKYKGKERKLHLYDTFEMIPPPDKNDGIDAHQRYEVIKSGKSKGLKGEKYYGYEKDLIGFVKKTLSEQLEVDELSNIYFIKGYFEETLNISEPVALAHIDCDWYTSVLCCLERIEPHLSKGGRLIIDDYHTYSGCKKAVDEYFRDRKEKYEFVMKSRLHIIKK